MFHQQFQSIFAIILILQLYLSTIYALPLSNSISSPNTKTNYNYRHFKRKSSTKKENDRKSTYSKVVTNAQKSTSANKNNNPLGYYQLYYKTNLSLDNNTPSSFAVSKHITGYYLGIDKYGRVSGIRSTSKQNKLDTTQFRLQTRQNLCSDGKVHNLIKFMTIRTNKFLCLDSKHGRKIVGSKIFDQDLCTWEQGLLEDHRFSLVNYKYRHGLVLRKNGKIRKPSKLRSLRRNSSKNTSISNRWLLIEEKY